MCNSRPVYRVGRTIEFRAESEDVDASRPPWTALKRDDAVAVARRVMSGMDDIVDRLTGEIATAVADNVDGPDIAELVDKRRRDERLSLARGLIVDLPNMVFRSNLYIHNVRCCLTVCQQGTRSKLWFRSQAAQICRSGGFGPPVEQSEEEFQDFFGEAEELGACALDSLREIYLDQIRGYIEDSGGGWKPSLERRQEFKLRVFDSDNPDMPDMYRALREGRSFTELMNDKLSGAEPAAHPALMAASLAAHPAPDPAAALGVIRNSDAFRIVGHEGLQREIGLFIEEDRTAFENSGKIFTGVAYDPKAHEADRPLKESPAYRVGAEILAGVTQDGPVAAG